MSWITDAGAGARERLSALGEEALRQVWESAPLIERDLLRFTPTAVTVSPSWLQTELASRLDLDPADVEVTVTDGRYLVRLPAGQARRGQGALDDLLAASGVHHEGVRPQPGQRRRNLRDLPRQIADDLQLVGLAAASYLLYRETGASLHWNLDDQREEGPSTLALWVYDALESYDPAKNPNLEAYIAKTVKHRLLDLNRSTKTRRVVDAEVLCKRVATASYQLAPQLGRMPTPHETACRLGIDPEELVAALRLADRARAVATPLPYHNHFLDPESWEAGQVVAEDDPRTEDDLIADDDSAYLTQLLIAATIGAGPSEITPAGYQAFVLLHQLHLEGWYREDLAAAANATWPSLARRLEEPLATLRDKLLAAAV